MKQKFALIITAITFFLFPNVNFAQAPPLGTAADFVLFTTVGAVSNTGISHLTGNVGSNSGLSTGFGNVDGQMHDNDGVSAQCAADLLIAYNQLNATVPTFFPAALLGNGQILNAGVYSIPSPATMNLDLILDGQNNPSAVFIFQIQGSFSGNANAKVKLINGALACNVFWKIEGLVSLASGVTMRGTVIANNAAINMNTGDTLEGRALSTAGAITIDGTMAYKPIGCGSLVLTGPLAPTLGASACYTLFSSIGPVTNVGVTFVTGDIGSDNGLTTGYNPLNVTGMIHPVPDGSTAACASDLINVYNYLNLLPYDIELLYPAQFGNNLVLTPHTYRMNAACTFTDTLFLNAEGNANAVFVIQINGALSTSTYSKVVLQNGTQSKNVYWKVEGAVSINDYSIFCGTIICNNGAINLNTGVTLDGRALTTTGAVNTSAINAVAPTVSGPAGTIVGPATVCAGDTGVVFTVPPIPNATGYTWTLSPGATITSGANTNSITVDFGSSAVTGNVTVQGSGSCGSGTVSANFTVTVNPLPIVTASSTSNSVCSGGSVTLTGGGASTYVWTGGVLDGVSFNPTLSTTYTVTGTDGNSCSDTATILINITAGPNVTALASSTTVCVGDSVTLNGNGALTYVWTGGVLDGVTFLPAATATYTVTGTDINNCSDTATATVTVTPQPVVTATASATSVCSGSSVTLTGGGATTYVWSGGVLDGISFNPTATTTYTVTGSNGNNCSDTATILITVNASPIVTASANPTSVCIGDSVTLNGSGALTYVWSGGVLDGVTFLPTATTTYTVTGTNGNSCSDTATVTVNVNALPIVIANASATAICSGSSVTLTGSGATTYVWSGGALNGISFIPTSTTTYTVTGSNGNNCSDTATITIQLNPSPTAVASGNSPVCLDSTINLSAQTVLNGTYTWTGPNSFSSSDQNPVIVSASFAFAGTYTLTVTNNGCTSAPATVIVIVSDCNVPNTEIDFHIPDGFSPNGDGINDLFVIRGIEYFPENTFSIYNRWGNKVFEANPYQNTWDGTATMGLTVGGDQLPVGTYFYVLDLNDGTPVYKGNIYLNR